MCLASALSGRGHYWRVLSRGKGRREKTRGYGNTGYILVIGYSNNPTER